MFDIIIKNGELIDGNKQKRFTVDIGIIEDTIISIGYLRKTKATKVIDAKGLIISPGFIDIHSHSDSIAWALPNYDSKIMQGVTTEVIGNCGVSLAPCNDKYLSLLKQYSSGIMTGSFEWVWRSFAEYINFISGKDLPLNLIPLIGHGTVRIAVMGFENRKPKLKELNQMQNLVEEAMNYGAYGLSSGLVYPPGSYSDSSELINLCKVVSKYDGIYATHIRNESNQLIEAVEEALLIGEKSGVKVLLSHHKAMGRSNWGKVDCTLEKIDQARNKGIKVWLDQYPYLANSTLMNSLVPP